MKIDEILDSWKNDSKINDTDLLSESSKIPLLHCKYYDIYIKEAILLKKYENEYNVLYRLKSEYYSGRISQDDLDENGWQAFDMKILKQDLDTYITSDNDIINCLLKIGYQKEKTELLKSIITSINNRSFLIKNMIEWLKFTNGN